MSLGPVGERGLPHPWWTPLRVVLALGLLTFALSVASKGPCAAGAWWSPERANAYLCQSDLVGDYTGGLSEGRPAWQTSQGERYTVRGDVDALSDLTSYGLARGVQAALGVDAATLEQRRAAPAPDVAASDDVRHEAVVFAGAAAVVQGLMFLLGLLLLARGDRARAPTLVVLAAAPVVLLTTVNGWQPTGFLLACAAWWAWGRGSPGLAGALAGVAALTGVWPLAILLAVLLVGGRTGRRDDAGQAFGCAVIAGVLGAVLLAVLTSGRLLNPVSVYRDRTEYPGSLWYVVDRVGAGLSGRTVNAAMVGGLVVVLVAVALWALRSRVVPSAPAVGLLLVLGWFAVTKAYEPSAVLLVLPFAALAHPRWRDLLLWQACELFFVLGTAFHDGGATLDGDGSDAVYALSIVVRLAGSAWLAYAVVAAHRARRREGGGSVRAATFRGAENVAARTEPTAGGRGSG